MRRYVACLSITLIAIAVLPGPADAARRNYKANKAHRKAATQAATSQTAAPAMESAAASLIASALRKELVGDNEARETYLRQAIERDADLPSALALG